MHFQAGNKGFLPLEDNYSALEKNSILKLDGVEVFTIESYFKGGFVIEAQNKEKALEVFNNLYNNITVKDGECEPMLNLLTWVVKENGEDKFIAVVMVRDISRVPRAV